VYVNANAMDPVSSGAQLEFGQESNRARSFNPASAGPESGDVGLRGSTSVARTRLQAGHTARRVLNIAVSLVLLALTSPLMLIIAFLIKATSPGPVLYNQPRVGLDRRGSNDRRDTGKRGTGRRDSDSGGKVFTIYKFRTMAVEGGASAQVWASPDDPRITRIGDLLRKYRLDELPQLFNVLRGEMNLVGPRPEQPVIFKDLRAKISSYQTRQRVLPGITGWAQVNNAYDQCLDDVRRKVDLDLEYIEQASVAKDLAIMAKTLPVMVFKKGAQ